MLESAYRLFCARGWGATTMHAIATDAGVAVQTLYFTFHTKGSVLGEVLGAAIQGFERWAGPPAEAIDSGDVATLRTFHGWFARFDSQPDARRALAQFIDETVPVLRRAGPLVAVMQGAWGDPEARAVFELGERRRAATYRVCVEIIGKKRGGLRRGLGVKRATDILLVLCSGPTFQAFVARGWSDAECKRWLTRVAIEELLN